MDRTHDMSAIDTKEPCSICQGEGDEIEGMMSLPCGHVFGAVCLIIWLLRPGLKTCPMCRRDAGTGEVELTTRITAMEDGQLYVSNDGEEVGDENNSIITEEPDLGYSSNEDNEGGADAESRDTAIVISSSNDMDVDIDSISDDDTLTYDYRNDIHSGLLHVRTASLRNNLVWIIDDFHTDSAAEAVEAIVLYRISQLPPEDVARALNASSVDFMNSHYAFISTVVAEKGEEAWAAGVYPELQDFKDLYPLWIQTQSHHHPASHAQRVVDAMKCATIQTERLDMSFKQRFDIIRSISLLHGCENLDAESKSGYCEVVWALQCALKFAHAVDRRDESNAANIPLTAMYMNAVRMTVPSRYAEWPPMSQAMTARDCSELEGAHDGEDSVVSLLGYSVQQEIIEGRLETCKLKLEGLSLWRDNRVGTPEKGDMWRLFRSLLVLETTLEKVERDLEACNQNDDVLDDIPE